MKLIWSDPYFHVESSHPAIAMFVMRGCLFGDIAEEIKAVSKIIDFQDKQKAKFFLALKN